MKSLLTFGMLLAFSHSTLVHAGGSDVDNAGGNNSVICSIETDRDITFELATEEKDGFSSSPTIFTNKILDGDPTTPSRSFKLSLHKRINVHKAILRIRDKKTNPFKLELVVIKTLFGEKLEVVMNTQLSLFKEYIQQRGVPGVTPITDEKVMASQAISKASAFLPLDSFMTSGMRVVTNLHIKDVEGLILWGPNTKMKDLELKISCRGQP